MRHDFYLDMDDSAGLEEGGVDAFAGTASFLVGNVSGPR
jgi:hypothetical protein